MAGGDGSASGGLIQVIVRLKVPSGFSTSDVFGVTKDWNQRIRVKVDQDYTPVTIAPPRAAREELRKNRMQLVVIRAWVARDQIDEVGRQPYVDHVARDAPVDPFARSKQTRTDVECDTDARPAVVECGTSDNAVGTADDVARQLGARRIWDAGYRGRGVVVGVVDGGITAYNRPTQFGGSPAIPQWPALGDVIGGWPPQSWGTTAEGWGEHGNMIAFDVQAMAPEAELWDIRIWQPDVAFPGYVSSAISGYTLAIEHYRRHGVPQILVNSWGVYDSDSGPDYAFNPSSSFALQVEGALDAGLLILFAAGNCGDGCRFSPGTLCGLGDRGPGASILGPNGHPEVMTVGAATLRGDWCGYTSQGPAALPPNDPDKPDFCAFSQFEGFFPNESGLRPYDGGTSAATAIAAGLVALLKEARPSLTQEECKQLLKDTARPISIPAASRGAGAGILDGLRAFRAL
jgi:subtilisin family serine protease